MFSIYLGPSGFGLVSQLINFQVLLSNVLTLGVPVGLTAKISELYASKESNYIDKINTYWAYFLKLILFLSLVCTFCIIVFSTFVTDFLVQNNNFSVPFSIIVLGIPFIASYSIIDSFLKSFGEISMIVKISIAATVISTALLVPMVIFLNINGVFIGVLFASVLPISIFILFYKKRFKEYFKFEYKSKLRTEEKLGVLKIGVVSLSAALLHQGAIIFLRKIIFSEFGEVEAGIYQSVLGLSLNYFSVIYALLSSYTLPKLSSFKNDDLKLCNELNDNLRFLYILIIPSVLAIFSFRELILKIVYTDEFLPAENLFIFQLIGDIFRMLAALFGLWLIPRMKIFIILSIDLILNSLLVSLPILLLKFYPQELRVIPISYMVAFFFHFLFFFLYTKKILNFRFTSEIKKIILFSILFVSIGFGLSQLFVDLGYYVIIPLVILWLYIALTKTEKSKILMFLKNLLKKFKN